MTWQEYVPTTEEVRDDYRFSNQRPDICGKDFGSEFDLWFAEVVRQAKAEARRFIFMDSELAEVIDKALIRHGEMAGMSNQERWDARDDIARAVVEFLGERHEPEPTSPPVYLALDLWQALNLPISAFDGYYERNGWANTWANLLSEMRIRSGEKPCGNDEDGEPCVLLGRDHPLHFGESDVGTYEPLPVAPQPSESEREALEQLIDKALDGDCGYGVGAYLAKKIIASGFSRAAAPAETDRAMQIAAVLARGHAFTTVDALSIANAALKLAAAPAETGWVTSFEYASRDDMGGVMCQCPTPGGCPSDTHRREVRRGPWEPVEGESDE